MREKATAYVGPLMGMFLLLVAVAVMRHELKSYSIQDVLQSFSMIAGGQVAIASALTALGYGAMTGYDALAFRYLKQPLAYWRIAITTFISTAFSNTIGFALLTGSAIRYRLYTVGGINKLTIAQVIAFSNFSFWLGLLAMGSVAFLTAPLPMPVQLHLPFGTARPLGGLFLVGVLLYLVSSLTIRRSLVMRQQIFRFPAVSVAIAQIVISSLDWGLAAAVLYTLLPASELTYFSFLNVYLLAMAAGGVSNVPGGVGVFETVTLLLLSDRLPATAVLAALLACRLIYYLLPFAAAAGLLLLQEIYPKIRRST
ncbi:MAG: hypothetical protein ACR2FS_16380 [Phormidesmis sp.]